MAATVRIVRTARIILGYVVSTLALAVVMPTAVVWLGGAIDAALGLPRWRWGAVNLVVAAALGAWGLWWMAWSWWFLVTRGRGHPTEAFGVEVTPVTQQLVSEGPYARTRNPMVFGYFFVLLGVAKFHGSWGMLLVVAALAGLGTLNIVAFEEPRLERRFGEAYRQYRRRVARFMPRLRSR